MAGILANSASQTMVSGDTSADNSVSAYVAAETVTLSATPTGSTYVWGLSIPSGSSVARSALNSTTLASPTFRPDVAGSYVVTCVVDSTTTYVLRIRVVQSAITTSLESIRHSPILSASVTAPSVGAAVFYDSSLGRLRQKLPDGSHRDFHQWKKYTLTYSDFSAAATTGSAALFTLQPREVIDAVVIKHSASFTGGSITAYTISVGLAADNDQYATALDVFQAPADDDTASSYSALGPFLEHWTSTTPVLAYATSTGGNLDTATAGSVDILVLTHIVPEV